MFSDAFDGNTLPNIAQESVEEQSMDTAVLEEFCENQDLTATSVDGDVMDNVDVDVPSNSMEQQAEPKFLFQFSGVDETVIL